MNRTIPARFSAALRGDCRVRPEDHVLAGISGGIDSVVLLTLLHMNGQPVTAAVFDHGLRPEAAAECDFVENFCTERGILCIRGKGDSAAFARENALGIEEAARILRYRFLMDAAASIGASAAATAHHANDQAETVLMHILRGSSINGLRGIRPFSLPNEFSDTIPLIRPLLSITRKEIETFAAKEGLQWKEDRSNADDAYTRNRIRLDLIPKLEQDYNPGIVSALCRLAETAAADSKVLDELCSETLEKLSARFDENSAEWDRLGYTALAPGLRLRMLRELLAKLRADEIEPGFQNLKEADYFFMHARQNQYRPFSGGFWLKCEGDKAAILKYFNINESGFPQYGSRLSLIREDRTVMADEIPELTEFARNHPEMAVLDTSRLASDPVLRTIRKGERFDPCGLHGRTQKCSDLLINCKVPREYRAGLAVAADDLGILWIPGLRVCSRCAVRAETRQVTILKLGES